MEAFITRDALHGKLGYFLVTASMVIDYINSLSIGALVADYFAKHPVVLEASNATTIATTTYEEKVNLFDCLFVCQYLNLYFVVI